jgi:hypothetical protein
LRCSVQVILTGSAYNHPFLTVIGNWVISTLRFSAVRLKISRLLLSSTRAAISISGINKIHLDIDAQVITA